MKLLLHQTTVQQLNDARRAPAGTYLFFGASGRGKFSAALEFARQLNCRGGDEPCPDCRRFQAGSHPQLTVIAPTDKPRLGIETIRALHADLALQSYSDHGRRVVVIDRAETLTPEAQNALLKLIEEPPLATTVILVATTVERLLSTVRSRCQTIFFPALTETSLRQRLLGEGITSMLIAEVTALADGSIGRALQLARDETERRSELALTEAGASMLSDSLFERLMLVRRLSEDKSMQPRQFIEALRRLLQRSLRSGSGTGERDVKRLEVIEVGLRRLDANVTPRLTLESLAVEL